VSPSRHFRTDERKFLRLRHFACFCRPRAFLATLRPAATRAMLCSCGQGEDGTGFLPFPLSWVQLKRNGARLATEPPLPTLSSRLHPRYLGRSTTSSTWRLVQIESPVRSQGLGNDGARLDHDGAAFMVPDNRVSPSVEDLAANQKSAINRHRGSGHPLSPATPPYMRVRIRRFGGLS